MNELIFLLTLELAKKKNLTGPELTAYLRGLHFCEGMIELFNQEMEKQKNGDDNSRVNY